MNLLRNITKSLLVLTFLNSCGEKFDWEPDPYAADSINQIIVSQRGDIVRTDESRFDEFICFPPENIASLRTAIGKIENKKKRKKAMQEFRKHFPKSK